MVPLAESPVICTSRMNVFTTVTGGLQVRPLSVDLTTWSAPPPTAKLFHETYIRPKKGEAGLLSDQPDSRSSEEPEWMQKWVQPVASPGLVVLYPPMPWPPQAASRKMANQVPVLVLYRVTGSPKVLVKGLWPLPAVRRVKVVPPSLENDAPEMLIGFTATPRESL